MKSKKLKPTELIYSTFVWAEMDRTNLMDTLDQDSDECSEVASQLKQLRDYRMRRWPAVYENRKNPSR